MLENCSSVNEGRGFDVPGQERVGEEGRIRGNWDHRNTLSRIVEILQRALQDRQEHGQQQQSQDAQD